MKNLFILLALLAGIVTGKPASKYLRAGAIGAGGTGDDWANAYTNTSQLKANLSRNSTNYIAAGYYTNFGELTTAASSSQLIAIKRATVADHGTSTGWSDAYDDHVTMTNHLAVKSSDWLFDGVTGSFSRTANTTNVPYGITMDNGIVAIQEQVTNITVRKFEIWGNNTTTNWIYVTAQYGVYLGYCTNIWIVDNLIRGVDSGIYSGAGSAQTGWDNRHVNILSNVFHSLRANAPAHCNVVYCSGARDWEFAWNYCFNYADEGFFVTGYEQEPKDIKIHNNIFSVLGGPGGSVGFPRAVELRPDYSYTNIYIFNNTAVSLGNGFSDRTGETGGTCSGCVATNNLSYASGNSWGSVAQGNNTDDSTDRFVNRTGLDFRLAAALAGVAVASQYSTDIEGNVHGVDGVVDRGALQFGFAPTIVTNAARGSRLRELKGF